ncbi:hypothetical protein KKG36_03025 [Patescibacteria group bacterium]|nr:hypothetical protein [Patescibacteria group bacterium]
MQILDLDLIETPKKIIWDPFWSLILSVIVCLIPVINVWWWLIIPILLVKHLEQYYLWWIRWDFWVPKKKWAVLEITPPRESLTPFKAMEDIFTVIWTIYDGANWREKWCEGELDIGPEWASFEIAGAEGDIHFYIRCLDVHRHVMESAIYSHYPETEIRQVSDYTKSVPQNIPNEDWNIYGCEFILAKDNVYPIKTYSKFFEPGGEKISQEEKRIDPIVSFLESLARLGPGENLWFQIVAIPIAHADWPMAESSKKAINKIAKREDKKEYGWLEAIARVISGFWEGFTMPGDAEGNITSLSEEKSETGEREMLLTPGEREILQDIEEKLKKPAYVTVIRGVYIAKRKNWNSSHRKIGEAFMPHFGQQHENFFVFHAKTRTKIHWLFRKKRLLLRQRKMFMNYVLRYPPMYPKWLRGDTGVSWLGAEELATIWHFPTKISALVAPKVVHVEAKRGGPPPNLPVE